MLYTPTDYRFLVFDFEFFVLINNELWNYFACFWFLAIMFLNIVMLLTNCYVALYSVGSCSSIHTRVTWRRDCFCNQCCCIVDWTLSKVLLEDSRRCVTWASTSCFSLCSCTVIQTSPKCMCIKCFVLHGHPWFLTITGLYKFTYLLTYLPLPSSRQCPSHDDCLEVKREYYQNSSVLDCVTQCSQSAAHLCEQFLPVKQIGFVTLGPLRCA